MAAKKEIRSDNTYMISTDDTDNPKLGAKILSDGRESLFLDYYLGYKMVYDEAKDKEVARKERKREALKLYLWQAPRTPLERQQNQVKTNVMNEIKTVSDAFNVLVARLINQSDKTQITEFLEELKEAKTFEDRKCYTRLKKKIQDIATKADISVTDELIKELDNEVKNVGAYI